MSRTVSIVVGIAMILVIGSFVHWQIKASRAQVANTNQQNTGMSGMTMSDVAAHSNASSCWSVIDNTVYDLTSWIPQHPGGQQAILQLCGKDGSEKFNDQHGGMEPMVTVLAGFKIGELSR